MNIYYFNVHTIKMYQVHQFKIIFKTSKWSITCNFLIEKQKAQDEKLKKKHYCKPTSCCGRTNKAKLRLCNNNNNNNNNKNFNDSSIKYFLI